MKRLVLRLSVAAALAYGAGAAANPPDLAPRGTGLLDDPRAAPAQRVADPRLQLLGTVRKGVYVRLTGEAHPVPEEEQVRWRLRIFQERPYYRELYPPYKHDDSLVFAVRDGYFQYLDLVSMPIQRVYVPFGGGTVPFSGYRINEKCGRCGSCRPACPENCIETGDPVFRIRQENCLQCGACAEACPRGAIERVGD